MRNLTENECTSIHGGIEVSWSQTLTCVGGAAGCLLGFIIAYHSSKIYWIPVLTLTGVLAGFSTIPYIQAAASG